MKAVLICILLLPIIHSFGQIENAASIDSIFAKWDKPDSPGCMLGIMKDNKFIYTKGYGQANMEYNIPNSATSVFRIGSTSKQFTAACIIILAQQKKLRLDDNLKGIFSDFPDYATKITIRHLLNHTSGIRDYLQLSYLKGLRNDDYYTDSEIMEWLVNQSDLNFAPGEEFLYSNSGYWLLGQIVNKISGMNMAEFATKEIFEPLGMRNTHFHNDHTQIVKNRASGYAPLQDGGHQISMTTLGMIGDGGIFTTINDIKKWDDAFYQSDVLNAEFWEMMCEQGVLNDGEIIDYAAGLSIGNYKGLKTVRHAGSFVGFNAELIRFPEQKLSIAIFANTNNFNAARMANQVADIVLAKNFKATENENSTSTQEKPFINLSNQEIEKFSGTYWNSVSAYQRKIYVKNDTLRYYRNEYSESDLLPIGPHAFKMLNVPSDVIVSFDLKEPTTMNVTINGGKPILLKSFTPKTHSPEELSKYIGNYYSQELDVNYNLTLENNSLLLFINDKKKSNLNSVMEHLFSNDEYGTIKFTENSAGGISGFRLASGRVKNLEFRRR